MQNDEYEYRATYKLIHKKFPSKQALPATGFWDLSPVPPKGDHWVLLATTTVVTDEGTSLVWTWERVKSIKNYKTKSYVNNYPEEIPDNVGNK